MLKDKVIALLKEHKNDLERLQVKSIYLFGSVARGEERPNSDIDVLVVFEGTSTFDGYMDLKFFLEELLERKVDLITEAGLRPELKKSVHEDLIRAA